MLQTFGLVYGMVQRFSQKFPVSFSAVSITLRIGADEKIAAQAIILHTALTHIWFLWDVKEPRPLFDKSRGLRPCWCDQALLG